MKYIFLFIFLFYLFIYLFIFIIIFRYAIAYLRTGSYAPVIKRRLGTKCGLPTRVGVLHWPVITNITLYMYKWELTLLYAIIFFSFSPLLEGGQFHVYLTDLTAEARNAVPLRIFVLATTTGTHSSIYDYY